jgi:cytoskeletal protein CcmA (bactofilin family)
MQKRKEKMDGGLNTFLGKDSTINGELEVEGGVRIDGTIKGSVKATETVIVGAEGVIEADIDTKVVVVGGRVSGVITALDKVELQSKSVIIGEITTKNLVVEQGAIFHGKCNMKEGMLEEEKQ